LVGGSKEKVIESSPGEITALEDKEKLLKKLLTGLEKQTNRSSNCLLCVAMEILCTRTPLGK
jgi:hypothetical protein